MKKTILLLTALFITGCSSSGLQGSVIFEEVWEDYANEFNWWGLARLSQDATQEQFFAWSDEFEKKRSQFVRLDEEEKLQGSTIIAGEILSRNREQYELALQQLQTITTQQQEIKPLIRKICEKQKSSVNCDL